MKPARTKLWSRFSLTTKILVVFLALSVASLAIVGVLALISLQEMGDHALHSQESLGQSAIEDSSRALQELGEHTIRQKAEDVALQIEIYINSHSDKTIAEIRNDDIFRSTIAVQSVGETGYTVVMDVIDGNYYFHPFKDVFEGRKAVDLFADPASDYYNPPVWNLIESLLLSHSDSGGYYDWIEPDTGQVRAKYLWFAVVDAATADGRQPFVAATTYIDEFSSPVQDTTDRINEAISSSTDHINSSKSSARYTFIGIFLAILIVVTGLAFWLARTISKPVVALSAGVKMIGAGQLDHQVHVRTGDEIEELAESFNKMASDLKAYIRDLKDTTAAKERIESELRIATEIQISMLPRIFPPYPDRKEFDVYATMSPAKEVGGDFYDFFLVTENKFCFIIGDVCGKGVPAALFMAISKTLLKMEALAGYTPAEVLERVNNTLYPDNDSSMFFTGLCAILDTDTGELCIANGGHNPPLLRSNSNEFQFVELPRGIPVGPMPDIKYQSTCLTMSPGSVLFLYTDGVTEATNIKDELFSEARLQQSLLRLTDNNPVKLLDGAIMDIEAFVDGAEQSDDITIMVLRFNGKEPNSGQ
ncbi:SpoIIE family protein phosphatase [Chloroflexota bacterium]